MQSGGSPGGVRISPFARRPPSSRSLALLIPRSLTPQSAHRRATPRNSRPRRASPRNLSIPDPRIRHSSYSSGAESCMRDQLPFTFHRTPLTPSAQCPDNQDRQGHPHPAAHLATLGRLLKNTVSLEMKSTTKSVRTHMGLRVTPRFSRSAGQCENLRIENLRNENPRNPSHGP
jgi:hypothetical protein